jgi:hypothetical protein
MPIIKNTRKVLRKIHAELGYITISNKQLRYEFKPDNEREFKTDNNDFSVQVIPDKSSPHRILYRLFASTHHQDISPDGTGFIPDLCDYSPIKIPGNGFA